MPGNWPIYGAGLACCGSSSSLIMNRRNALMMAGASLALGARGQTAAPKPSDGPELPLEKYEPKSMLHLPETKVPRSRYPVIDFHTHITQQHELGGKKELTFYATAEDCLAVMDRKNVRTMVNLTGGYGANLETAIARLQASHPGRFVVFMEPAWDRVADPGYATIRQTRLSGRTKRGRAESKF